MGALRKLINMYSFQFMWNKRDYIHLVKLKYHEYAKKCEALSVNIEYLIIAVTFFNNRIAVYNSKTV